MENFWPWAAIVAGTVYMTTQLSTTAKYYVKYFMYHIFCILLTIVCGPFCLFRPGSSKNIVVPKLFSKMLLMEWWFGINIKVENGERLLDCKKPSVIVSNHQSSIDALICIKAGPIGSAPLAKEILFYVPIFGQVCWLCGTIFINRKKGKTAIDTMKKVGQQMREYLTSLWIFAEGTRMQVDSIGSFKKGAFHLAVQAQCPIVPVVIGNYRNVLDRKHCMFEGGDIRVKCLEPISTEGLSADDVNELLEKCRNRMVQVYNEDFDAHKDLYGNLNAL